MKKTNQKKISKNSEEITIQNYEKIGNRIIKLDIWGMRLIILSSVFLVLGVFFLFLFGSGNLIVDNLIELLLMIIVTVGFIYSGFILLIISLCVIIYERLYIRYNKYNEYIIINQFFKELSKEPDENRKYEILMHIYYNLSRLLYCFNAPQKRLNPSSIRSYTDYRYHRAKFIYKTLYDLVVFLENLNIYCNNNDVNNVYYKISECFKTDSIDYILLGKILKENMKLFNEFIGTNGVLKTKTFKEKIGEFSHRISDHEKTIIVLIAVILSILYVIGVIPHPSTPY